MVDELKYKRNFPNPPKFKSFAKGKFNIEVPKFYGFDHPCTKWLLSSIVSQNALNRLIRVALIYSNVLERYHQIPDRPNFVTKERDNSEPSAYNNQAILYLQPLSVAVYMKYEDAMTQLVNLKDADGNLLVNPNELNFVQNFWRKGETKYFSDLITSYPALIAIRRNYCTAFKYLLMAGYNPNESFTVLYRKPHREILIQYRDIIDYVIDYLKTRPAFNVGQLMYVLLKVSPDSKNLDIFCFDIVRKCNNDQNANNNNDDNKKNKYHYKAISLFQRITQTVMDDEFVSEENGMHILIILEKIQIAGYFIGFTPLKSNMDSKKTVKEILDANISEGKIYLHDLQSLPHQEIQALLVEDYAECISHLIIWLQNIFFKRRAEQTLHLLNLLTKIFLDTRYIELFFKEAVRSDGDIKSKLSQFPHLRDYILDSTVFSIRSHINLVFQQSHHMIAAFISKYKMEPCEVLYFANNCTKSKYHSWLVDELMDYDFKSRYLRFKGDKCDGAQTDYNQSNYVPNVNNLNVKDDISKIEDFNKKYDELMISSKVTYIYREHKIYKTDEMFDELSKSQSNSECITTSDYSKYNADSIIEIDIDDNRNTGNKCGLVAHVTLTDDSHRRDKCINLDNSFLEVKKGCESDESTVRLPITGVNPPPLTQRRRNKP